MVLAAAASAASAPRIQRRRLALLPLARSQNDTHSQTGCCMLYAVCCLLLAALVERGLGLSSSSGTLVSSSTHPFPSFLIHTILNLDPEPVRSTAATSALSRHFVDLRAGTIDSDKKVSHSPQQQQQQQPWQQIVSATSKATSLAPTASVRQVSWMFSPQRTMEALHRHSKTLVSEWSGRYPNYRHEGEDRQQCDFACIDGKAAAAAAAAF